MKNKKYNKIKNFQNLPHSLEAEQYLLGGLLINNNSLFKILDCINKDYFYRYDHKIIFKHILKLINNNKAADIITVYDSILNNNQTDEIGGLNYMNLLVQNTSSFNNIRKYAKIIKNKSILRKLISVSNDISYNALNPKGRDIKEILNFAETKILSILEDNKIKNNIVNIKPLLNKVIKNINNIKNINSNISGISTGFKELDKMTSGLQAGDLIIIAGRPSMGKTALSINIGENIAINYKLPVIIFSMEMNYKQIIMRIISSIGNLDNNFLKTGHLMEKDWLKLSNTVRILNNTNLYIDETPSLSPIDIKNKSNQLFIKHGKLGLIIIDYLQLMITNNKFDNRTSEVSYISRNLKKLAREFNCPIIALSQLNRSLEKRDNKRPIMSDLRDSGAIEQDADLILFIYRDEVYNPKKKNKGISEIIIGKQRNGPIGIVNLLFKNKYVKYINY